MLEHISLFVLGGGGYLAVELAWRGTSHWTMFLAGGICLCALQWLAVHPVPLPVAAGTGALGASALEVVIGVVCRNILHVQVWDYSAEWGNIAGLICPRYTFYWFLLCGWVVVVLRITGKATISPVYCTRKAAAES